MKLEYLRYFMAVARNLNFTKAANECHIAQTAMSRHIAALEQELHVRLFERDNRNVRLTPAGISFYNDVLVLLSKYDESINKITLMREGLQGQLKIGVGLYEGCFVAKILQKFHNSFPDIEVRVTELPYSKLWDGLKSGMLDIIFPYPLVKKEIQDEKVKIHPLFKVKYCILASKYHPYAQKKFLTAEDFSSQNIVSIYEDHGPLNINTFYINSDKANVHPVKILRTHSLSILILMVQAGYGIGFAPNFLKLWLPQDIVIIDQKAFPTDEYFALTMESNSNPITSHFVNFLHSSEALLKSFDCDNID